MRKQTAWFSDHESVPLLLERCARDRSDHVFCRQGAEFTTCAALNCRVNRAAHGFSELGVGKGTHVAVMLGHHLDHITIFFALMKLGAVQVPINVNLRGPGLAYIIDHSAPELLVADGDYAENLDPILAERPSIRQLWRDRAPADRRAFASIGTILSHPNDANPGLDVRDDDLRTILYTSGTTGPAKGVEMTDRMLRAAALGSIWIGNIQPGSVLHFWDPIYHVFGSEVLVLSLMVPVTLALVPRFSASRFWDEVREYGATHIHFVGGVLQLLLKQPPTEKDRDHGARTAWGGGCPVGIWREFEDRFGIEIREGYGMTETSSFSVINTEGKVGAIGKAVDYFEVEIVDENGALTALREVGEIRVAENERGVMVARYHKDPETTGKTIRDGWLYTGDIAYRDEGGFIFFLGRKKDSLRRRGENISAWEVERVINDHPSVEESALIGVTNELADEDLKLFVKMKPGQELTAAELLRWCEPRLASFQIPRFVAFVDEFRKTPTQRIQKQFLSKAIDDGCFDRERIIAANT
ncbi:AMP-binding protein [Bradyrhizobium sp. CCGUVB1N3]|uniref:AMP-binding protein n=1 Tax=Bradyrhizobium sp. CCGUVB1N3 TaxID=2949629 RepID=UPI0020B3FEF5|nr:AMP-binding protein [Bradyrhizobium sp. CCGUVB1N3]MCP3469039.1 AMP-binding protein [Bradyrhizobium sp. CCGUVB1N3]